MWEWDCPVLLRSPGSDLDDLIRVPIAFADVHGEMPVGEDFGFDGRGGWSGGIVLPLTPGVLELVGQQKREDLFEIAAFGVGMVCFSPYLR